MSVCYVHRSEWTQCGLPLPIELHMTTANGISRHIVLMRTNVIHL